MGFLSEVPLGNEFASFAAFQQARGFIPNLLQAQSLLPRVIEAQTILENAVLGGGTISQIQKERILLSIAAHRQDTYCMSAHSRALCSLGASDNHIDDLLSNYRNANLSPADLASMQFCLKLARHAPSVNHKDIETLRSCGFIDEAIFESVLVAALAVYRCTLSAGLGPNPDFVSTKFARVRNDFASETASNATATHNHETARRKGPYVSAPYLSSKAFAPFLIVEQSHGFIPNFFRAQTLLPGLLEAELEAVGHILLPEDALTRAQKECILLAVSAANLNSYCVAMHCNLLRGLGIPSDEGDQIAVDHHESSLSETDKALLDFAVKLGTRASEFSGEDVLSLRRLGFTQEQILECEVVTALNNFANTLQMGLGVEPDFAPPIAFIENKMNLRSDCETPIKREADVYLVGTLQNEDAELVADAQSGSLAAFEELARRHTQLIYRTLIAILGNYADAQDGLQDTLLSAFKHIREFQGRAKFSTWLVSIARNTALQRLRRRRNMESLDESDNREDEDFRPRQLRAWQDDPEQCHSKSERRQLVERGILALPAKYRVVVMLRDIEQLSTDDVAHQLGLSVPAVKTRLLRGRLMLREFLSPHLSTITKGAVQ